MPIKRVCVLGGTGFVGRRLIARVAEARPDLELRILTRRCARHRDLQVFPAVQLLDADVHDRDTLRRQFRDVDAVVNLVGILNETYRGAFQRVHVELAEKVADSCRQGSVERLLHMSALGADASALSAYQRSKAEGERRVLRADGGRLAVTSFRPSLIFGPGDGLFCRFSRLLRISPGVFPLPTPSTRFQPVWVGDVAEAFLRALDDRSLAGQALDLCGPKTYTLKALVEYTAAVSRQRRRVVGVPDALARVQARVLERLPGKPYTYDNYLSTRTDNVCSVDSLQRLGIVPAAVEAVVPHYLGAGTRQRAQDLRRAAGR